MDDIRDVLKRMKVPLTPERRARILARAAIRAAEIVQAQHSRFAESQAPPRSHPPRTMEVDPDLLRALELAITSNNVEVIDAILGVRHDGNTPR